MITRRRLLALAPLPAALVAPASAFASVGPLPVPGGVGGVPDCLSSWRQGLPALQWDGDLALECEAWAAYMSLTWIKRGDVFNHAPRWRGRECIARLLPTDDWARAIGVWAASPDHLPILQRSDARRVGMGGWRAASGLPFWCLRMEAR